SLKKHFIKIVQKSVAFSDDCIKVYYRQVRQHQQAILRLREEISDLYASYSLVRTEKATYLTQKSEKEAQIETLSQEIRHCEVAIGQLGRRTSEADKLGKIANSMPRNRDSNLGTITGNYRTHRS
ncbi:hypothetical protein DW244_10730, partial [Streptococcus pasteurianus]